VATPNFELGTHRTGERVATIEEFTEHIFAD
jgi:hypothetical protein